MPLLDNVAKNLRALCAQHGSVYKVCQELGMAPQQFAHYLNAERLPNEATRQKLCAYFEISEDELIQPPGGWGAGQPTPTLQSPLPILQSLTEMARQPTTLAEGIYFTYFQGAYEPDLVVRSVTVVEKEDDETTTFYRLTGYADTSADLLSSSKGKHRGIALEHAHWIYLIAQNVLPTTSEPSYLAVQWRPSSDRILAGYGIVSTITDPSPVAVVLKSANAQTTLRAAIRQCGAFEISDSNLERSVVRILKSFAVRKL
jgi:transcriptional regulator with XRE-family HTH domain